MSYRVTIQPKDHAITVGNHETVLEAALREGHVLPYSCRGGTCGSCVGRVVEGEVRYPDDRRPPALSEREATEGKALFCQARPASDLVIEVREIDGAGDIQVRVLPCRVMRLQRLAPDVMQMTLRLPATERLQYFAGQYIDILLRDGRRRSFSLANPPHVDDHLELHVRHVPRGQFSDFVFHNLREKSILRFQGPLGTFFLRRDSDRPIIMIAGGTGFAPIKAMLEDAFHQGLDRPVHFYWGARARRDLYLHNLPQRWAAERDGFRYTPVLSEPAPGDDWDGRTGWVHAAVAEDYPDLGQHEVYMSGPPPMIAAAKAVLPGQGLDPERLFYDSFEYAVDD
ncbi:MAG: CDP-6-deoxy-delta-3,4-glucoseen reductase [Candidatus Competibacterales bacterium]|nr:CDP-6-deoxy-delta-3,4-glucoseen reductase [Candidatus Competibacterales bacterium]